MARKKWTANEEITDSLLKFREKRKWQLAFRRYILERNISEAYAPYFGLDIENYRKWIALQFVDGLSWDNFGTKWQFDHIVPVSYFDFGNQDDLKLCWNFINIAIEVLEEGKGSENHIDILAAKPYFEGLYKMTGNALCIKMFEKIISIEQTNPVSKQPLADFMIENKEMLEKLTTLSAEEFSRLNKGMPLDDIFLEREILQKFG